ncbi:MAG: hypothetical protein AB1705_18370, partial [Verrucomicrobiota bacterium]
KSGVGNQRFMRTQQLRANFQSPPAPPVLERFEFEQSGQQVRLIDQDGSVYVGEMLVAPKADALAIGDTEKRVEERVKDARAAQTRGGAGPALPKQAEAKQSGYDDAPAAGFRVQGINRTLNQPVDFTGNFLWVEDAAVGRQMIRELNERKKAQALPATNLILNGRATVGGQQIQINAVPTR